MIYLDNSATTKPNKEVLRSFISVSENFFGNPSSLHGIGVTASTLLEKARSQAASIIGVKNEEIIFTSGGTESNNLAIKGIVKANQHRGSHLITSKVEHPSVQAVFEELKEEGFQVTYLSVNKNGVISLKELEQALSSNTILVSLMHVNNEVGSVQPIEEAGQLIKKNSRAHFHVDAVQSFGKVPLHIEDSAIDLLSLSAHKFHGMKGTGLLVRKKNIPFSGLFAGGEQERGERSGTENVAGAVSMAKAMRMMTENHFQNKAMDILRHQLVEFFSKLSYVTLISPTHYASPHILNVSVPGLKGEVIVHALERANIYVSTTSACSSKKAQISRTIQAMGFSQNEAKGSVRISMSHDTTQNEIDQLQTVWNAIIPALLKGIN